MKTGRFNINILDCGTFALDGGAMFGVVPKALWAKAYHPGDEYNRIPLALKPLLIQTDKLNILVDTGIGNKHSEKFIKNYSIDSEKTDISIALSKYNLSPEDINMVIFTHLHFDHAGGATKITNNGLVPVFPNAEHIVQKGQLNWAKKPAAKDKASFIQDDFIPILDANLFTIIDEEAEIIDGLSVSTSKGHSEDMMLVHIDDDTNFLYAADLIPTAAHISLPYIMAYDNKPLHLIEEKRKVLLNCYEESRNIIFEHDAFFQAASLNLTEKGIVFGKEMIIS